MRFYFIACVLLFIAPLFSQSIKFHRTFGFKAGEKVAELRRINRKPGILTKIAKIDALPRIPPQGTLSPNRIVPQISDDKFDICLSNRKLCANNGICHPDGNSFYCQCKPMFYGKRCELLADDRKCENNLCENDSTCYSVNETRVAFKNGPIQVNYMCWCKPGYMGDFCEYNQKMRECAEDVCNYHGIISSKTFDNETKCECQCENYYSGQSCEIVSPCRDFECINDGICKLNATGQPYCECPKSLGLSKDAKVFGDHCEDIEFPDKIATDECRPCSTNFADFLNCLKSKSIDTKLINYYWAQCENYISTCLTDQLSKSNCFNNGKCVASVEKFNELSEPLAMPRCECRNGFEGTFCERRMLNACEKLAKDERCIHGRCAYNSTSMETYCICDSNHYGLRCELKRPCANHDCKGGMCIELPFSPESEYKFPACVCKSSQTINSKDFTCNSPHFNGCFNLADNSPKCKNDAFCYPCLQDNDKDSIANACNDEEFKQGFRCICPPGYSGTFCARKIGPCDSNHCKNNAKCMPSSNDTFDYSCLCPKGYSGTFCEASEGTCARLGHLCKNGVCKNDAHYRQGFYCECKEGFSGVNCDYVSNSNFVYSYNKNYVWSYPLTLFIFLVFVLLATIGMKEYSIRQEINQSTESDA